jgi:hypothetical protein
VQEQTVVEHLPTPRRVEPLPVEEQLPATGRVPLPPLHSVLHRPRDVEQGALERLEIAVAVFGDQRADGAEGMIGVIAEAEDRLERAEEPGVAALVVAVKPRDDLRARAEHRGEIAQHLPAEEGLPGPVGIEELRVIEVEGETVLPGEVLGSRGAPTARKQARGDRQDEQSPARHRALLRGERQFTRATGRCVPRCRALPDDAYAIVRQP